jgi:polyisoprenoid-binding protein YceI
MAAAGPDQAKTGAADARIGTASFRTGNEQRDSNVRSERRLDAGRYLDITAEVRCTRT